MAKKILVIDDEADLLTIAVVRLQKSGYDVIKASDGASGLELMKSEKPDLVLLDLVMPNMDGYEVCEHARKNKELKNIPIILFTATLAADPIEDEAKKLGVVDYLTKPFDAKVLLEKIEKALKK